MAKRAKYLISPGEAISANDGEIHYVGARQLIDLYGVDPAECVIDGEPGYMPQFLRPLTRLGPDNSGRYEIPEQEAQDDD